MNDLDDLDDFLGNIGPKTNNKNIKLPKIINNNNNQLSDPWTNGPSRANMPTRDEDD